MSYVVAFVKFTPNSKEFPVNCLRADLVRGDDVIVRRADGSLRYAIVTQSQYLNWHCMACIECKKAEASIDGEGRSEEHTSELQSRPHLVCRLLLEKKKKITVS